MCAAKGGHVPDQLGSFGKRQGAGNRERDVVVEGGVGRSVGRRALHAPPSSVRPFSASTPAAHREHFFYACHFHEAVS